MNQSHLTCCVCFDRLFDSQSPGFEHQVVALHGPGVAKGYGSLSEQSGLNRSKLHALHVGCFIEMAKHAIYTKRKDFRCPLCRTNISLSTLSPVCANGFLVEEPTQKKQFQEKIKHLMLEALGLYGQVDEHRPVTWSNRLSALLSASSVDSNRPQSASREALPAIDRYQDNMMRRRIGLAIASLGVLNLPIDSYGTTAFILCLVAASVLCFAPAGDHSRFVLGQIEARNNNYGQAIQAVFGPPVAQQSLSPVPADAIDYTVNQTPNQIPIHTPNHNSLDDVSFEDVEAPLLT